jgi:hypothetical protein
MQVPQKRENKILLLITYHKAVAKKVQVEPTYMGLSQTLKGKPVTRALIKMPK